MLFAESLVAKRDSIDLLKSLAQEEQSTNKIAELHYDIAVKYHRQEGSYDSALFYAKKAYSNFKSMEPRSKQAKCLLEMASIYVKQEKKEKSISCNEKAYKIYQELKDTLGIILCLNIQSRILDPKDAIIIEKKAIVLGKRANVNEYVGTNYINLGYNYEELGNVDSAEHYYVLAIKEARFRKDKITEAFANFNLGTILKKQKKFKEASIYISQALKLFKENKQQANVGWVIPELVKLFIFWKKEKPYEYAQLAKHPPLLSWLNKSEKICNKSDDLGAKISLEEAYSLCYEANNNYKLSNIHLQKLLKLKDRRTEKQTIEATAKFAEELKTIDQEKEIIKLNADKKIEKAKANRNLSIFVLILLGLLASAYFIYKRIKYRNLKEQEERDKNFRTKLSSDLHDDVGTILTSLSMQSELLELKTTDGNKGTVGKIANMSRDATRRMRDTVWAIDSRKDNVMDLAYRMIDFADDMLGAKEIEFQLKHNIEGKADKISAELRQNIFLIFKEAITNAAKYCSGELVTASLNKSGDKLALIITNETKKIVDIAQASGLGLSNIQKRTEEMNGLCKFETGQNSFQVKLSFPL